jgi:hypothetical protein
MNDEKKKELFAEKIAAGSRIYLFDVKEAEDGTKYLVISESVPSGENNRVMVFEKHLKMFEEGMGKAFAFLGVKKKTYYLDEIRRMY